MTLNGEISAHRGDWLHGFVMCQAALSKRRRTAMRWLATALDVSPPDFCGPYGPGHDYLAASARFVVRTANSGGGAREGVAPEGMAARGEYCSTAEMVKAERTRRAEKGAVALSNIAVCFRWGVGDVHDDALSAVEEEA